MKITKSQWIILILIALFLSCSSSLIVLEVLALNADPPSPAALRISELFRQIAGDMTYIYLIGTCGGTPIVWLVILIGGIYSLVKKT